MAAEVSDGTLALRARVLVCSADTWHEDAVLALRGGRIVGLGRGRAGARLWAAAQDVVDLGESLVAPGWVNAHAHLELTGLAACARPGLSFEHWVGDLLAARRATPPAALARAASAGAMRLLRTGTTTVGDIDSLDLPRTVPWNPRLRRVVYREVLDGADPVRRAGQVARIAAGFAGDELVHEGLSPHAPFSVSDELLAAVAPRIRALGLPVAMHWAETAEEVAWLAGQPAWFDRFFPRPEDGHGLALLERHGLLGSRTALIHGNHPRPGEPERIARAGATVVHCPRSHAYFQRPPFPASTYRRAQVSLALGTDSLASNSDLDLRAELTHWLQSEPGLDPRSAFDAATRGGARALGLEGQVGVLASEAWADFAVYDCAGTPPRDPWSFLCQPGPAPREVWVGGRLALGGKAPPPSLHSNGPRA
jgi:cytosine/adenosine deaminase-related metal-dependent hydrolase